MPPLKRRAVEIHGARDESPPRFGRAVFNFNISHRSATMVLLAVDPEHDLLGTSRVALEHKSLERER